MTDPGPITQVIDGNASNSTDQTSITVTASVQLIKETKKLPVGITAAYGDVEVGDWASILDSEHPLKSISITLEIPPDLMKKKDACIILTVPPSFLPRSTRSSVCIPTVLNKSSTHVGTISAFSPNDTDSFCKNGSHIKLLYKSNEDFFLSKEEKWSTHLHLIYTSYILFCFAFFLIFFSIFQMKFHSAVTNDKIPLRI